VRIAPEAVAEAERLLAAPVRGGRRKRPVDHGIPPEIVALLDGDGDT
jgi:hypothetical protein